MSVAQASTNRHEIAEGPHWDERSGSLWYVDVFCGDVCKLNTTTQEFKSVNVGGRVSLVLPYCSSSDQLIVAMSRQLKKLDWKDGKTEVLIEVEKDKPDNKFNDGKCDKLGRLWVGTLGKQYSLENWDPEAGSLYSMDDKLHVKKHAEKFTLSNGMTWSLDWEKMFFIDSIPRRVYVFDYNLQEGSVSNQRVLVDFQKNSAFQDCGLPDGMTSDIHGRLWIACIGGGKVICVDPETGALLHTVKVPAKTTTSCCFGGPDYSELFITSGRIHMTEAELKEQPNAGSIFRVTGLGTKGLPAHCFAG